MVTLDDCMKAFQVPVDSACAIQVPVHPGEAVMKMPKPDPAGRLAARLSPRLDAALKQGDLNTVVSLALDVTYRTAVEICQAAGIPDPRPSDPALSSRCRAFQDACDAHLAKGDDHRVLIAREAFVATALAEAELRPRGPTVAGSNVDPARIFLLGSQFGQASSAIGWITSGTLTEYGEAIRSRHNTGAGRRGIVPKWETDFLPVAVEYCSGKDKVPLADLRRHAEKWAAREVKAGKNPELPGTEKGILDGLKRMESSGRLRIPGRPRGN
jgi:hypothetical protein